MTLKKRGGFTLIELAIVVLIIAILAALAIPLFALILKKSRFTTLASDLRTHGEAFTTYAVEHGNYPPTHEVVGVYVPELTGDQLALSPKWLEPTAIGGRYTWVYTNQPDVNDRSAYIQVIATAENPFAVQLTDIRELDEEIDDGSISSGYLQVAGGRVRYYLKLGDN